MNAGALLFERRPVAAIAALVALSGAAFCFVVCENLPIGLLQVISASLHTSVSSVGLLVTTYALVVTVTSAPLTKVSGHLPRRALLCGLVAIFVVGTLAAASSPGYWWLLSARIFTAMAQALFWSVVAVTAVSLFPAEVRGRAVAGVFAGGSFGVVLGVPVGTWLGQQGGWRLPFILVSGLGLVILVAMALLLPAYHPTETHAGTGSEPSRRRFRALVATTGLAIGGYFAVFTYVSSFLTHVPHLSSRDVPAVLLVAGAGAAIGVASSGALFDRYPGFATMAPVGLMTGALLGVYVFGTTAFVAVPLVGLAGVAVGGVVVSNQNRVMIVAPASTDVASAWASAAFNLGIAGGSLIGSLVVASFDVRAAALAGGLLAAGGLAVVSFDVASS